MCDGCSWNHVYPLLLFYIIIISLSLSLSLIILNNSRAVKGRRTDQKTHSHRSKKIEHMGRAPCCDKANVKKGPWSPEEDSKLKSYIEQHGTGGNWIALPQKIGMYYIPTLNFKYICGFLFITIFLLFPFVFMIR